MAAVGFNRGYLPAGPAFDPIVFLILITICIIYERDLLSAIMTYSAFSFCAVLLYLMMGSPDVAFTEVVVGTVSTIFYVIALKKLDRWCK